MHHNTITRMRRSSYRRRSWLALAKPVVALIILTGTLIGILILLGGWAP